MLVNTYNKFIAFIEAFTSRRYWYVWVALIVFATVWLLTTPSYFALGKNFKACEQCVDFQAKINRADHILTPTVYKPAEHMAKTELRLTIPMLAKVIGTRSKVTIFLIQQVLGLAFFALACLLTVKITKDKVAGVFVAFGLGFIYAGKASIVDVLGFTDAFAYFFLLLACYTRYRLIIIGSLLLAFFTDERAIAASGVIALMFLAEFFEGGATKINARAILKSRLFYVFTSWIICFALRYFLYGNYGLHTPSDAANHFNIFSLNYVFWEGLQGLWIVIILAIICLLIQRRIFMLFAYLACMVPRLIIACMVADLTRSAAYIFPAIFTGLYFFKNQVTTVQLRQITFMAMLICLLSADNFYITGQPATYYQSLPAKVFDRYIMKNQVIK